MKKLALAIAAAALTAQAAHAYEAGDMIVRAGGITVEPQEHSSTVQLNGADIVPGGKVGVDNNTQLGLTFTYMLSKNWGVELLAATPFKHDIYANSNLGGVVGALGGLGNKVGSTKHLPPTVTVQYHMPIEGTGWNPYVGVGLNYTTFFSEDVSGQFESSALGKSSLKLTDSVGLALQAGVDYRINENWLVNAAVWYIDIETDATIKTGLGKVKTSVDIDPWVYMLAVGYKF